MKSTCRTCLKEIQEDNFLILGENQQALQFKRYIAVCVPEIVLDKVIQPIVCFKCVLSLHAAYEFKTLCLQTETRIDNHLKNFKCDKFEISDLESSTITNKSIDLTTESPTRDVIDDLNELLDEALNESSHLEPDENQNDDDVFVESESDSRESSGTDNTAQESTGAVNKSIVKVSNSPTIAKTLMKKKGKRELLKCNQCDDFSTIYSTSLTRHLKTHENKKNNKKTVACAANHEDEKSNTKKPTSKLFSCDVCGCKRLTKVTLRKHYIKFHRKDPVSDVGEYIKNHVTEYNRNQDVSSNKQSASYLCTQCTYKASTEKLLNTHIQEKHNANPNFEKKFSCHKCSYKGLTKLHLIRHSNRHRKEESTYCCNKCEFKAISKAVLTRHINEQHNDSKESNKLFSCTLCTYKGNSEFNLKRHFLGRHVISDEIYPCSLCAYKGSTKELLKRHTKNHHKSVVATTSN